ncbi:MAG TPA: septal ring lytic transglycosylase RlpA family protein [Candidatus Kapabacteria bacterium]|nr:septal ring lytic transglycosylase RlpA family protein [Candidatus Kapabacteria bacterium]
MINSITYQQTNGLSSIASELSNRTVKGAVAMKKRASISLRKIVAIALFAVGALVTLGSTVNLTLAKARKVKGSGQFRLLNIYNTLRSSHPGFIQAMNKATTGLASWYGGMFHGRKTAMGTTYNMYAMTAAHRSLPLGTWVKVTNDQNGKSVVVQVTDRGPYVANRIMDLSYAAAQKLGYANAGTTHISMKVLGTNPDATEVADAAPIAAPAAAIASDNVTDTLSGMVPAKASIIPALFRNVSALSSNVSLEDRSYSLPQDSADGVSSLLTAVTDLVSGSPSQAVAEMFA